MIAAIVSGSLLVIASMAPLPANATDGPSGLVNVRSADSAVPSREMANRKGSKRIGGNNSKGKGSKYVGGRKGGK